MLDAGIDLTPGMAYRGQFVADVERFMSALPVLGSKVTKMQNQFIRQWNEFLLNEATKLEKISPNGVVTDAGREGFKQAQDGLSAAYNKLWSKVTPKAFEPKTVEDYLHSIPAKVGKLSADDSSRLVNTASEVESEVIRFLDSGDPAAVGRADKLIRDHVTGGAG